MRKVLLTTEYEPDYGFVMNNGKLIDLCDGSFIVSYQDGLLALSSNRQQKLGIHLIASNMGVPVTVLENPTKELFIKTICEERFDDIGFTVLVPGLQKVEEMISLVREHSPNSRVIIGGHGVDHDYAKTIGADLICRGDGISFMQQHVGRKPERFVHPTIHFKHTLKALRRIPFRQKWAGDELVLLSAVGCPMGCEYCPATSFYDRKRFSYMNADQMLETIFTQRPKHRGSSFYFWDQDFFLDHKRARKIGEFIQTYNERCTDPKDLVLWATQASIKTLSHFTEDQLFNYGCRFLSIGVEASDSRWEKRKGIAPHQLFKQLHYRGIGTFGFYILGWDNHDLEQITTEVDYLLSLNPTINHFTLLTPEPGTDFYLDLQKQGKLLNIEPRCFNYATLQFLHPNLNPTEATDALNEAYLRGTRELGPIVLRRLAVKLKGFHYAQERLGRNHVITRNFAEELAAGLPLTLLKPSHYPRGISYDLARRLTSKIKEAGIGLSLKVRMQAMLLNGILSYVNRQWTRRGQHIEQWQPKRYQYKAIEAESQCQTLKA